MSTGRGAATTTGALKVSMHEAEGLVLNIDGERVVIDAMPLSEASYRVYGALMQLCPIGLRKCLMNDPGLYLNDPCTWWWILNEMREYGISLPVVEREEAT
jgi:hypothetical protein